VARHPDQVGKQFDGMVHLNGNKLFSVSLVAQIKEQNVIEHMSYSRF
jgi:hypothetical protein